MIENWIDETLYEGWRQRFLVKRELARFRSPFQEILIFDSVSHGRVLMLDGVVQITEADEFVYQEMLAHVPLVAHGSAKRVLIIGAGDGGVLRRVLEHKSVERVSMVEIDGDVIRLARQFIPSVSGNAWDDPRASVIVGDGIDFVANAPTASVDVMIVDSTDPIGVGEVLFTEDFYRQASRVLGRDGLIVNQCGVPAMQGDELRETTRRRRNHFAFATAYVAAVPTYVGGLMTLGIASNNAITSGSDVAAIHHYAKSAGLTDRTNYWTPEIQKACFTLPPYISRYL